MLSELVAAATMIAQCQTITTVNMIEVHSGLEAESREYYRVGWRAARKVALDRGYIAGYEMLVTEQNPDEPELVLITRYSNATQFAAREKHFLQIFEDLGFSGPITIDGLSRSEMLGPTNGAENYRVLYSDSDDCPIPGHETKG